MHSITHCFPHSSLSLHASIRAIFAQYISQCAPLVHKTYKRKIPIKTNNEVILIAEANDNSCVRTMFVWCICITKQYRWLLLFYNVKWNHHKSFGINAMRIFYVNEHRIAGKHSKNKEKKTVKNFMHFASIHQTNTNHSQYRSTGPLDSNCRLYVQLNQTAHIYIGPKGSHSQLILTAQNVIYVIFFQANHFIHWFCGVLFGFFFLFSKRRWNAHSLGGFLFFLFCSAAYYCEFWCFRMISMVVYYWVVRVVSCECVWYVWIISIWFVSLLIISF